MVDTPPMRASDRDREQIIEILNREMSQGRLTLAEFEERVGKVYEARTWADLRALVADLPVEVSFDGEPPTPAPAADPAAPMRHADHGVVWMLPYLLAAVLVVALAFRVPWVFFLLIPIGLRGARQRDRRRRHDGRW